MREVEGAGWKMSRWKWWTWGIQTDQSAKGKGIQLGSEQKPQLALADGACVCQSGHLV